MNEECRRHPNKQGAENPGAGVDHGMPAGPEAFADVGGQTFCDLSEYGIVRVSGADAKQFLQGQCTVDMEQLSAFTSRLGAFCNPKGRVLTLALFFVEGADYLLRIPKANIESILERLGRYVLRSRVELIREPKIHGVGIVAGKACAALASQLPEAPYDTLDSDIGMIVRVPGQSQRFEVYGSDEQIDGLRSRWPDSVQFDAERWQLLNIRAGVAEIYPTSGELFVPQMLDLERHGGVSFSKGCYTGQEIVARTQYLGRLKRRLVDARITLEERPAPGDTVFALGNSGDREAVGRVVCTAADERGGCELLVVVQIAALESQAPQLVTEQGHRLTDIGGAVSSFLPGEPSEPQRAPQ